MRCEKGVGHAVGTGRDTQGSTLYTPEFWDAVYHCWSAMLQSTCSSDACVLVARNTAIAAECEVLIIDVCVCYRATRASVKNRPMVSICTNVGNNIHRSGYSLMTAEFQAHRCSAPKMNNTSTLISIAMVHLGMTVRLTNTVEAPEAGTDSTSEVVGIDFDPHEPSDATEHTSPTTRIKFTSQVMLQSTCLPQQMHEPSDATEDMSPTTELVEIARAAISAQDV